MAVLTVQSPLFSAQSWMFETEKKGLISIFVDISKNALIS